MMRRLSFTRSLAFLVCILILYPFTGYAGVFWESGWEGMAVGCGPQVLDGGHWTDWWNNCNTNCSPCWTGDPLSVTSDSDKVHSGTRAFLETAPDCGSSCGSINGPSARIHVEFAETPNWYARWYLKQSPGWRSHTGNTLSRWVLWKLAGDCWWCLSDDGVNCSNYDFSDKWHYIEVHVHKGTPGHVQVRIDGVDRHLIWPGYGSRCNAASINTIGISFFKYDLVQGGGCEQKNALFGNNATSPHEYYFMPKDRTGIEHQCVESVDDWAALVSGHQWRAIDDVAFSNSGWIGPTDGAPSAPTNLRIE